MVIYGSKGARSVSALHGDALTLTGKKQGKGQDAFGGYTYETFVWSNTSFRERPLMETTFRRYVADSGMLIFEQHFPETVELTGKPWGTKMQAPASLFPSFTASNTSRAPNLDCFAYHGVFPALRHCTMESYAASHQGGAPLVFYNASTSKSSPLPPMTVFSPLSTPKAQHMFAGDGLLGAGVKGTVRQIPAGWRQLFLLSADYGILPGMMSWGNRMLKFTGKERAEMYGDEVVGSIGFWTDNGGYYHYATGSNESYEETLPEVKAYHDSLGIPFKHWQFDSWFYPKDGKVDPGGGGGAVINWTALPTVFPHGMAYIQSKLQVPMVMHNRQWSPTSDYVKNEPFKWYLSEKAAIPRDPEAFFRWFFTQQEGWGLAMYEQDWMCTEYDTVEALQTNISLADLWLRGMALGAASSGRSVQYCMPYPYDVLSAAAYPAVTNARASDDYIRRDAQWAIGATSMFYWAIGILPFKDGFYSSTFPQEGGQVVGPETHPNRAALMATLSGATVGPMDGIHLLNASRVMSTCRADGKVLKPDRPIMPLESCFLQGVDPAVCFKYSTYSDLPGLGRIYYIFMDVPETLYDLEVIPGGADSYAVYDWYSSKVTRVNSTFTLSAGYEGHGYGLLTPVLGGWAFVGERAKLVPASSLRFPHVAATPSGLFVQVAGVTNEEVEVCATEMRSGVLLCKKANFQVSGVVEMDFSSATTVAFI